MTPTFRKNIVPSPARDRKPEVFHSLSSAKTKTLRFPFLFKVRRRFLSVLPYLLFIIRCSFLPSARVHPCFSKIPRFVRRFSNRLSDLEDGSHISCVGTREYFDALYSNEGTNERGSVVFQTSVYFC